MNVLIESKYQKGVPMSKEMETVIGIALVGLLVFVVVVSSILLSH